MQALYIMKGASSCACLAHAAAYFQVESSFLDACSLLSPGSSARRVTFAWALPSPVERSSVAQVWCCRKRDGGPYVLRIEGGEVGSRVERGS
eukprot:1393588-Rhodomonas_salina.1